MKRANIKKKEKRRMNVCLAFLTIYDNAYKKWDNNDYIDFDMRL